ncbi:CPBP family intramembrane glutamic endopeptidase [Rhizobacter sp. J219]|uniref:CPBP family intramembrane glutamic endopeptidase n=1 Tax=Rhizobacter sp. J219 TaxID=2898430 RepID=UPI0035B2C874
MPPKALELGLACFCLPLCSHQFGKKLFFRRFLLELFPVQRSWLWAAFGGLATAAAFAAFHYSYMYPSTFVLLGVLGLIFAWVRIRSGTLWAPILLHAVAAVTGLLLNLLR